MHLAQLRALLPLNGFNSLLGRFRVAIASVVKHVPIWGHFACATGAQDATRSKLRKALADHGESVVIVPGGIAEMYSISPNKECLHLIERKGLLKLALETGAEIVPIYCFGNTETFRLARGSSMLQPLGRLFRAALLVFYGRFGLPISFEVPLLYVFGKALRLPKIRHPSSQDIDAAQKQFLAEVHRIFHTYKGLYGWQHKTLEIV
ncbi:mono- or diacylglycerol acyltransferase [Besnoitia besnoiti]|uniref:Mono-or diacylglycerol acyltransferase n=1 Tax=Besnoitia besnoiti TaxID=94643 RepID=A0A2A9LZI5_BESBE|nr:mono- or diacylglycerol acyltransferase [Besnoitia besnoiti]PFH31149.1 mono- or diacylglycerol acyltransferase [Besnoitia besnoiti]